MVQQITTKAIDKGQLPILIVGIVLIILVYRLPPKDSKELLFKIIYLFRSLSMLGWGLLAIAITGWRVTVKALRRSHRREMNRIAAIKTELLKEKLNTKLSSSK